jgi:coenzyme PQQ precursor peptide PqqA
VPSFARRMVNGSGQRPPLSTGLPANYAMLVFRALRPAKRPARKETTMAWTTPTLVEICIGLEINGYLPAEF